MPMQLHGSILLERSRTTLLAGVGAVGPRDRPTVEEKPSKVSEILQRLEDRSLQMASKIDGLLELVIEGYMNLVPTSIFSFGNKWNRLHCWLHGAATVMAPVSATEMVDRVVHLACADILAMYQLDSGASLKQAATFAQNPGTVYHHNISKGGTRAILTSRIMRGGEGTASFGGGTSVRAWFGEAPANPGSPEHPQPSSLQFPLRGLMFDFIQAEHPVQNGTSTN